MRREALKKGSSPDFSTGIRLAGQCYLEELGVFIFEAGGSSSLRMVEKSVTAPSYDQFVNKFRQIAKTQEILAYSYYLQETE